MKNPFKFFIKKFCQSDTDSVRETIEELIEESDESESSIEKDERVLLGNVLSLRDLTAQDVMIHRADMIAASADLPPQEMVDLMVRHHLTSIPVYEKTLDHILGVIHTKDVLAWMATGQAASIKTIIREPLFISPSMRTLDLLLQMRETGIKVVFVVDEYGGIDGLVTLWNLVEEIIGDIQDAHEQAGLPHIEVRPDQSVLLDGRVSLKDIPAYLPISCLQHPASANPDTIGGFVASIAGRVPVRGEIIQHAQLEFEILQADPRRVHRLCVRARALA